MRERQYTKQELMYRMIPKEKELEGGGSCWWYVCPECHGAVDQEESLCRHCGQALNNGKAGKL